MFGDEQGEEYQSSARNWLRKGHSKNETQVRRRAMTDEQFERGGHTYRVEGLTPMTEFHVVRRMGAAMVEVLAENLRRGDERALLPEVIAWGHLSNDDAEYVINACMGAVRRRDPQREAWQPVWTAGRPMFDDISREVMMHLVREVLRIRIGPFLPGTNLQASSDEAVEAGQPSRKV
jgi:hypothetical protein